ncbi:uncharacterized protein LOC108911034 [Anoplophora glabripennis]|uniref:uncharacterized protein LOC108911034 n=1 Tax=Anoplophora glabripennis TaxID=217634 RepID=UPI0008754F62|nr:uncharacterized protein LOC108911034 [Anoplophora glabripennis]
MDVKHDAIYLNIHKYIMIIVGKWYVGFQNKALDKFYRLYSMFFETFVILITQQIFVSIIVYRSCPAERVIELICYYIQYTNMYVSSLLCRRASMRRVYEYIFDYEKTKLHKENDVSVNIYFKYTTLNRRMLVFFALLTNITGAIWYILVVRHTLTEHDTTLCALKRGLNFQICVVSIHIYNKLTPVTFMLFELGQIKILQNMIRCIDKNASELASFEDIDSDEAVLITMRGCVKKHQEIIRLLHMMDNACKKIVLIIFFSNSVELAAFIVKLLTETNTLDIFRTFGILIMLITQIFMFFWYANEIQVQSTAISDILYNNTDWINYNKPARMRMLLMMIRSQKPLTFNAAAIGDMSIDTFKRIMKLCYSITAFVKTVFNSRTEM